MFLTFLNHLVLGMAVGLVAASKYGGAEQPPPSAMSIIILALSFSVAIVPITVLYPVIGNAFLPEDTTTSLSTAVASGCMVKGQSLSEPARIVPVHD